MVSLFTLCMQINAFNASIENWIITVILILFTIKIIHFNEAVEGADDFEENDEDVLVPIVTLETIHENPWTDLEWISFYQIYYF